MDNFDLLKTAVAKVGKYLKLRYGGLKNQINTSDTHYETDDDKNTDNLYQEILSASNIPVISEESTSSVMYDKFWLIDSIEGTTNYTHNNPFFATQGCLIENNKVICACIYAPILEQFYEAEVGKGAYLNGQKISIGKTQTLDKAIISPNKGTGKANLKWWGDTVSSVSSKVRTVRLFGAVGLEMTFVAAGFLDIHLNKGCHAYDDAPGSLIISEAGGSVVNFSGAPWTLEDSSIITGNSHLVKQFLPLL